MLPLHKYSLLLLWVKLCIIVVWSQYKYIINISWKLGRFENKSRAKLGLGNYKKKNYKNAAKNILQITIKSIIENCKECGAKVSLLRAAACQWPGRWIKLRSCSQDNYSLVTSKSLRVGNNHVKSSLIRWDKNVSFWPWNQALHSSETPALLPTLRRHIFTVKHNGASIMLSDFFCTVIL